MLKTIILQELSVSNTSEEEYDKEQIPAGKTWKVLEVRPYTSNVTNDSEIYLNKGTNRVAEFNSQVFSTYDRPYPLDVELTTGEELRLTGKTDGTSTDYIITLLINETGR